MASSCEERNCGYYWKDEDEPYARCHWQDDDFPAPCEEDEEYVEGDIYDDEMGFDPYEGCYTWDC